MIIYIYCLWAILEHTILNRERFPLDVGQIFLNTEGVIKNATVYSDNIMFKKITVIKKHVLK